VIYCAYWANLAIVESLKLPFYFPQVRTTSSSTGDEAVTSVFFCSGLVVIGVELVR
jgi:hypothetical protein